ncbi:NAD-dependent succinate-semialdehyde dehydrogenase [Allomuricauda sp. CP2A]|jgi:succinate-semialdehyde dehydrogenase/glutarate-semialdehyde dehydrogenase|uniref:NAD-dependent succinate-semialdehyde dehydrogenase n=1 Tax=Allomuricauda sp. CP2A TaxID=1848189 RepID=UPI00082CB675|nr:NAD-dependent succinate-semialdehyde dehydrogenase [Muricauda sp. CP2A]
MKLKVNNPRLIQSNPYIGGKFLGINGGDSFLVHNPFDNEAIAEVGNCGTKEAELAIKAANDALDTWKSLTGIERSTILHRWYELILRNEDDLARILTLEQGKPFEEAKGEIRYGASFIEWFAEEAKRVYGDTIPGHQQNKRIIVLKQPVGVVAAITPWNFPNAMITRKVAPALAAGCTIVVKPSELTPLSALAIAVLADEAGIPPGVLNVVTTDRAAEVGKVLTSSALVKKISFTGSTPVGKLLLEQCAQTVKKASMELGGNAPFIVFDDADIDAAIEGAVASKYRNAGQTCVCANRFFVQQGVYDEFSHKLVEAIKKLKVGNGMEAGVAIGPLIEEKAVKLVEDLVKDAGEKGGEIMYGGKRLDASTDSLLYEPTVITKATSGMKVFSQEIFGPVAPIFSFETEEEVIQLANDTTAGLAAYFYGSNHSRIWKVAEALEYGMVGINTGMISTTVAPFGGVKESGYGREGSKYGIEDYLNIKYLCWEI